MWLFCEGVSLPCRDFLRFPQVELVLKDMRWRAEASHLRATAASVKICQLPLSSRSRVIDSHAQEGSFPASREYRELQPFIARLAVVADGKQCAGTLLEVKPCAMDRPLMFCRLSTCAHIWLDGRTPAQMLQPLLDSYNPTSSPCSCCKQPDWPRRHIFAPRCAPTRTGQAGGRVRVLVEEATRRNCICALNEPG